MHPFHSPRIRSVVLAIFIFLGMAALTSAAGDASAALGGGVAFPRPLESYDDEAVAGLGARLVGRAMAEPFDVVATPGVPRL